MSRTEYWLRRLETETKSIKQGFSVLGKVIKLFTEKKSITTTKNEVRIVTKNGQERKSPTTERVQVTFNAKRANNTIATIEVKVDGDRWQPMIRRARYSGGARWIISNSPKTNIDYSQSPPVVNWEPTTYHITVHSMVDGDLKVENMRS